MAALTTRRQFLKTGASVLASLSLADCSLLWPKCRPWDVVSSFPQAIKHDSGEKLTLDRTRLLVSFKQTYSRDDIRTFLKHINQDLILEDETTNQPSDEIYRGRKVNHTRKQVWVRSRNSSPISESYLRALAHIMHGNVDWIGPVYQFQQSTGLNGLISVLPHILIVKRRANAAPQEVDRALKKLQLINAQKISQYLPGFRYYILAGYSEGNSVYDFQSKLEAAGAYKTFVESTHFEYMPLFVPTGGLDDPYYDGTIATQWNLEIIKAEGGWRAAGWDPDGSSFVPGLGTTVAVIDSGVDLSHPDLAGSFGPGATFADADFDPDTKEVSGEIDERSDIGGRAYTGDDPHGTCCAGIVGARCNNNEGLAGVSGWCQIMPLRVEGYLSGRVAAAIAYAAINGADVISMSFGGDQRNGDYLNTSLVEAATTYAYENRDVLLCCATMNSDQEEIRYPARHPSVMGCGASNQNDYRSQGDWDVLNVGPGSNYGTGLSVVAPGVQICTSTIRTRGDAGGDYVLAFGGTSSATPQVAALASLLISRYPDYLRRKPGKVRELIERSATRVHETSSDPQATVYTYNTVAPDAIPYPHGAWNNQVGYGRIDVHNAMKMAQETFDPPPAAPSGIRVS